MSTVEGAASVPSVNSPTRAEIVAGARALRPLVREHAPRAEAYRRMPEEVNDALTQAGMFRLLTPKRYGGYQMDARTVIEVTEALGEADGSTSWLVALGSAVDWISGLCSERGAEEIFGGDPDARIAGAVAGNPVTSRRVAGGWQVSGRWGYSSGSWHAAWACLGVPLTNETGEVVDHALVVISTAELTVEETWFTAGMKATGSNTFVADDVFVPEYRVMPLSAMVEGKYPIGRTDEALYRYAYAPLVLLFLLGPLLGLGRAALTWTTEKAATKPLTHTIHARQADSVGTQIQVAEAALKIETARLHTYRAADEVDDAALRGEKLDYAARARIRAQAAYAAQQVLDAINTLLNAHGAGSFAEANPMQRYWRDANTAARHAHLNPAVGYEVFGKSLLGVEEQVSDLV
jgi:3-hydroxy-9,10-secoandrosta-1,3,5(10)-triene-9,17-dione monooxygenase